MTLGNRFFVGALAALFIVAPLAAQSHHDNDHALLVGVYGGGYKPIVDLAPEAAYFAPGHDYGVTVGYELSRMWAVHTDFTYTRSVAEGNATFAGMTFDRYFYGAHAEVGYTVGSMTPYLFFGGGAVTINEVGSGATIATFTRPAGMFGAGTFCAFGGSDFGLFAEMKNLVYNWNRGSPNPAQWFIPTTGGLVYTVQGEQPHFNTMQWDFTYTLGVSYHLPLGARQTKHQAPRGEE